LIAQGLVPALDPDAAPPPSSAPHDLIQRGKMGELVMIGTVIILQAIAATQIKPPVMLKSEAIQVSPTAAARALTADALEEMSAPVTVTLQCIVSADGSLVDCIPADDGGTDDPAIYLQRLYATGERAKADPVLAAALSRTIFYRVRADRNSSKAQVSVLVREVISPTDRAPNNAPRGAIPRGGVKINPEPSLKIDKFYPAAARRNGAQTRVSATCLILDGLSLFCRKPEVYLPGIATEAPMWRQPAFDDAFGNATLRVLASMRAESRTATGEDSIGRELPVSINWQLP